VQALTIGITKYGDRKDAQLGTGARDADRDFTTVGNEDLFKSLLCHDQLP